MPEGGARAAGVGTVRALVARPAIVHALAGVGRPRPIDLLVRAAADIADQQVAAGTVEAEAPRVAQARRPDLARARAEDEAMDLAERRARVGRRVGVGVVADARVERAVRAELELAAVVVRGGVRLVEQRAHERRPAVLPHLDIAVRLRGQEHVEQSARGVVRRERHREQAALAAAQRVGRDIEERAAADDLHEAGLLDHEDAVVVGRRRNVDGGLEVAELDQLGGGGGRHGGHEHQHGGQERGAHQWAATCPPSGSSGRPCSSHATSPPSIE